MILQVGCGKGITALFLNARLLGMPRENQQDSRLWIKIWHVASQVSLENPMYIHVYTWNPFVLYF